MKSRTNPLEIATFCAIILIATLLRVYRLDALPPGLHYDEAFKGVEARQVLAGTEHPIFFGENMGEDPMRIYATALDFALFGDSPWSLRLASAFAGILAVAAVYALTRGLLRSKWTAALAAFTFAIMYWQLNFSRLGMEPVLTPLVMTLSFAFLWRGLRHLPVRQTRPAPPRMPRWDGRFGWFVLAGLCLGATQYTYQAALFVPGLVGAVVVVEAIWNRKYWLGERSGLIVLAVAALVAFAPIGIFYLTNPSAPAERPGEVMITPGGAGPVVDNILRVAGMFFVRGDENPRSNLPFRPVLDPFLAIGFIAGLIACVIHIRRVEARFLLLWLAVMVLPSVLTDFAPHFGRSIGVTPAVAITVAYGLVRIVHRIPAPRPAVLALVLVGLATSSYATIHDYFDVWAARSGLYDSFDVGYLQLAQKLRSRPSNETIYLTPVGMDHYTVQYGLAGRDARSFDGRRVLVLASPGAAADYGVVTREDTSTLARLAQIYPSGQVVDTVFDFTGRPAASIFHADAMPRVAPQETIGARLGDHFALIGYDVTRAEATLTVTAYWGCIAETQQDYTVFVHLVGPTNPATQSPVWAQDDTQPGRATYPTSRWLAGEVVVDEYRLAVPGGAPPGLYEIEMGMYTNTTGARLNMTDANGAPMENDRALTKTIALP